MDENIKVETLEHVVENNSSINDIAVDENGEVEIEASKADTLDASATEVNNIVDELTNEIKELKDQLDILKKERETTDEVVEDIDKVAETDATPEPNSEEQEKKPSNSDLDEETVKRLDERLAEIRQLKEDMAKLHRANDFTSTGNSTSQNNQRGRKISDEDIRKFWWKI